MNATQPQITDFPFDQLPQFKREDLSLKKRVLEQYSFLEDSKDFFAHFLEPFRELLPQEMHISLLQVKALRMKDLEEQSEHQKLSCLIHVLPHNKFAFLSFDPLLAKHLVTSALSGGKLPKEALLRDAIRPLTALEEGVVEYLVVSCLERIESQFAKKDFSLRFEVLLNAEQKLTRYFSLNEEMALFSFLVSHPQKDFHFQFALPLTLGKDLGWDRSGDEFVKLRTRDFLNFKIDFVAQVGSVELSHADVDALQEGDIVLLDQTTLSSLTTPRQGYVHLIPLEASRTLGFELKLQPSSENLVAEIMGLL